MTPPVATLTKPPIDFRAELNDDQYAVVTAEPGPVLVLAGAGSGKTRTLTYRVAYLLEQGIYPSQILLLTFTNKAAREMLSRVEDLTKVSRQDFWGGTFHSIGMRTLRLNSERLELESSFSCLDQSDAEMLLSQVIRNEDAAFLKDKTLPKPKVIAGMISYARNTQKSLVQVVVDRGGEAWPTFVPEQVQRFCEIYQIEKKQQNVVDYDDLLVYWLQLLKEHPSVAEYQQKRFKFVMVDEYQDTNIIQSQIADTIAGHHNIMAVGDDAQCIYTWRGANFDNIIKFSDRHPNTVIRTIGINYRSTPPILNLANKVLANQPRNQGFYKELKAVRLGNQKPQVVGLGNTEEQAEFIVTRIHGLIKEGYRYSDIVVLYRAHYQALDLQLELDRSSIPYIMTSGLRFFDQAHIKDVLSQVRFLKNPCDLSAFIRFACVLPKIGDRTAARLHSKLLDIASENGCSVVKAMGDAAIKLPEVARGFWQDLVQLFASIDNLPEDEPPETIVSLIIDGWYSDYLRNIYENWESRMDDLKTLVEFASRFDKVSELLAQLALLEADHELSPSSDAGAPHDALRLSTIHQAKGLEFPIVFMISLSDGLMPLRRSIENDDLEEERRLFYVASTRAKDLLYLSFPKMNMQSNWPQPLQPSRFLRELPKSTYEILSVNLKGYSKYSKRF